MLYKQFCSASDSNNMHVFDFELTPLLTDILTRHILKFLIIKKQFKNRQYLFRLHIKYLIKKLTYLKTKQIADTTF